MKCYCVKPEPKVDKWRPTHTNAVFMHAAPITSVNCSPSLTGQPNYNFKRDLWSENMKLYECCRADLAALFSVMTSSKQPLMSVIVTKHHFFSIKATLLAWCWAYIWDIWICFLQGHSSSAQAPKKCFKLLATMKTRDRTRAHTSVRGLILPPSDPHGNNIWESWLWEAGTKQPRAFNSYFGDADAKRQKQSKWGAQMTV